MRKLFMMAVTAAIMVFTGPLSADDSLEATARKLLTEFTMAVAAGPEALAPMLAPEYQIMRASGKGFDREGYLNRGVGAVSIKPDFSHTDIVATQHDDVMVIRYFLEINETIDGEPVQKRAPRLSVFRKTDGRWKVVAHANFARHE